ncbi:FAD-binding oxidoreductase [Curvibacter sp. CHRR-16]|uniref:NAD(P)/FAD-dependent oxidoreductase n=1 Tax=Curvibacter sp. CHRR-16 TaxID=2835872 RepID=UPI001BDA56D1|nr:FAD-dependent oxidoreductase [Curvibacter sp. CHRR-16]MBT0569773.1 FAD-binding oxidoreductase [Curvibacter sp. CHRR-16]
MNSVEQRVAVLGAGVVGVTCALELQRRGFDVVLIDRQHPGHETSYGNAGVIARSSLVPFNNPTLWRALPKLLRNRSASFRYDPAFLARNAHWALAFLSRARQVPCRETTTALDALIRLSMPEHRRLLGEAGELHRWRENGWMFLYRSEQAFADAQWTRDVLGSYAVSTQVLDGHALSDLEPALRPIFPKALWIKDTASVDSPGRVVEAYTRLFVQRGGTLVQREIRDVTPHDAGWELGGTGPSMVVKQLVLAVGPWAKQLLGRMGLSVPMAYERGYHMHYGALSGATLHRPVYDTGGGYVLSPMEQGLRLTTGVQLADLDAPKSLVQLDLAERAAREALPLGARLEEDAWLGRRPTLPDSRPVIGPAPRLPGLWLAFGHQHVGFSTSTGTAALLGALMQGESTPIDPRPFSPLRWLK